MFEKEINGELYFTIQVWNELNNIALCAEDFIIMLMNVEHNAIYIKYS